MPESVVIATCRDKVRGRQGSTLELARYWNEQVHCRRRLTGPSWRSSRWQTTHDIQQANLACNIQYATWLTAVADRRVRRGDTATYQPHESPRSELRPDACCVAPPDSRDSRRPRDLQGRTCLDWQTTPSSGAGPRVREGRTVFVVQEPAAQPQGFVQSTS